MAQNIDSLKLFYDNDHMQVAIFAGATESSDGWMRNLPWEEVFIHQPHDLTLEVLLPLEEIQGSVTFQPTFLAEWVGGASVTAMQSEAPQPVNLTAHCRRISRQTGIPREQVRKVCTSLLSGLARQIEDGVPFLSPMLIGTPVDQAPLPAAEGEPPQPARKFMQLEATKK